MRVQTEAGLLVCTFNGHFKQGDRCLVCVRPERVFIGPAENRQEGMDVLPRTVNFPSSIGNTMGYNGEMQNGKIFKVDVQNPRYHQPLPPGEMVYISFPH